MVIVPRLTQVTNPFDRAVPRLLVDSEEPHPQTGRGEHGDLKLQLDWGFHPRFIGLDHVFDVASNNRL